MQVVCQEYLPQYGDFHEKLFGIKFLKNLWKNRLEYCLFLEYPLGN